MAEAEPNGHLLTRVGELIAATERVEGELIADRAANEARMRTNRIAARIAIVVGLIGLIIGAGALLIGRDAQATANDIIAARKDARLTVCLADNKAAAKEHQLWDGLLALPRAEGSAPPNEATIAAFQALLTDTFPQRDCSPAAIAAYYGGSK